MTMKINFDSSSFFCMVSAVVTTAALLLSTGTGITVNAWSNAWTPASTWNNNNNDGSGNGNGYGFTYGNTATQATATAGAPPFSPATPLPQQQEAAAQQEADQQSYAAPGQGQYHQHYQQYQQQQQQQQRHDKINFVETRRDHFGGTGLYATRSIRRGEALYVLPENDIVFSPPDNTPLDKCVNNFCISGNGIFDSISIGASLATWRLFQKYNPQQYLTRQQQTQEQEQQQEQEEQNEHVNSVMRQAGITEASQGHAESLPWEKARWQLPLLWPEEVLDQALHYGVNQAYQQEYEQSLKEHATAAETATARETKKIQDACEAAKSRVNNFQTAAARLAEELGPSLQKEYGIRASEEEISLVCHQAMGLVFSRSFTHPPSGEMTMFPIIDSANHNANPNAKVKNDFDSATIEKSNGSGAGSMLVAQYDIKEGEEITISYGLEESGNVLSFSGYGFVPQGMAQESAVGRALQMAAQKGQEIAKERLEQQQQQHQQDNHEHF